MAAGSPFFREIDLSAHGLRWIHPEIALAHPLDDEAHGADAAAITNPFRENAAQFGSDEGAVRNLFGPLIASWAKLAPEVLAPIGIPAHPFALARFGLRAIQSANTPRAVLAGMCAHSFLSFNRPMSGGFGLILWTLAYAVGWPFAAGGAQSIPNALASLLRNLGGEIVTNARIASLGDLPPSRAILCDITPRQFLALGGAQVSPAERRLLQKFRYGPGCFKVDWALRAPIPWNSPACRRAGTVHVGGTFEEIAEAELAPWQRRVAERPFVLVAQPSLFDPSRAPAGKHTAWAYCHVPHAGTIDMLDRIEAQIERFARGFRDCILARTVHTPRDLQASNANYIGGDIAGGSMEIGQLFLRPNRHLYRTSIPNVYTCSASTPPGPGVHGMCGYAAAKLALRESLQ
jgi:phytoene dehydrogenase-like protein